MAKEFFSDGKAVEASVHDGFVNNEELCRTEARKLQVRAEHVTRTTQKQSIPPPR